MMDGAPRMPLRSVRDLNDYQTASLHVRLHLIMFNGFRRL